MRNVEGENGGKKGEDTGGKRKVAHSIGKVERKKLKTNLDVDIEFLPLLRGQDFGDR